MQKKTGSTSQSSWRGTSGPLSTLTNAPEDLSGKLYDSINTLTLERFLRCDCENDLKALIIDGDVPRETLESLWAVIYENFLGGMQDSKGIHKIRLMGKINHLEFTYSLIRLCIKFLSKAYDKEIIDILSRFMRVAGKFNPEDQEGYFKDLQVLINLSQGLLVQIENKKAEYAAIGGATGKKATRADYERLIAQVSIFVKFHLDKRTIMVSEFIEYYTNMRQSHDSMQEKLNKR